VARGIDLFDCVLPTRNGRHGLGFTSCGPVNLKNAKHAEDPSPLDRESSCPAARDYSRAYLHHLLKANEMLGAILLTSVNVAYYQQLMADIRAAIRGGRFDSLRSQVVQVWGHTETFVGEEPSTTSAGAPERL
jgi:queuine tRNA-ribosyltransferase